MTTGYAGARTWAGPALSTPHAFPPALLRLEEKPDPQ